MIDHAKALESTHVQLEVTSWRIICIMKRKNIFKGYSQLRIAAKVSSLCSALLYGAVWEIAICLIRLSTQLKCGRL